MEDCKKDDDVTTGEKENKLAETPEEPMDSTESNQEHLSLTRETTAEMTTDLQEPMEPSEPKDCSKVKEGSTTIDPAPSVSPQLSVDKSQQINEIEGNNIAQEAFEALPKESQDTPTNPVIATAFKKSRFSSALGHIASEYTFSSSEGTEDEDEEDDMNSGNLPTLVLNPVAHYHRALANSPSSSSSTDSDSDIEIIGQINDALRPIEIEDDDEETSTKPRGPIRAKGELLVDDLPPIEDLHITVPEEECVEFGKIQSIVEQLVLVNAIPGTAYLNLDTVLFLEKGHKVLGAIFDVIGQVTNPLYCVRFNSNKHIQEKNIEIGQTVYVAPRTEHTQFLILDNLITIRGSDASWEDDVEPPEKHLDYSDDEEERNARRAIKNRNKPQSDESDSTKKARPVRPQRTTQQQQPQQQQQQQSRLPRPRNQGGYQQRGPYPNYDANYQPPFQYSSNHTAWHANYAYPPPPTYYSNPYQGPQYPPGPSNVPFPPPNQFNPHFSPPSYPGQQFPVRNQFSPQFAPPAPNMRPMPGYTQNFPPPSPPSMN